MTRWLAGAMLALALGPTPAMAAERGVVLNDTTEASAGYCQGTITASSDSTTTLAIDACRDGGVTGLAPGDTHAFPKAAVHAEQQGLAMAAARKQFFASPRIAAMLQRRYMPSPNDDFTALTDLAEKGGLADWQALIGILPPIVALRKMQFAKPVAAYTVDDFKRATDLYRRFAADETAAIRAYAAAYARMPFSRNDSIHDMPDFGAGVLAMIAISTYDLQFNTTMPDAWLSLQIEAARACSEAVATYRHTMTPLGLSPFFISELKALERSDAGIEQAVMRTYTKVAEQAALKVLTDTDYAKPDAAILADVRQAMSMYSFSHNPAGRDAIMARAKAELAAGRKLIAALEPTLAAVEGQRWQLTITETDGDPPRHYVMVFARTGAHALEAKIYVKDLQYSNLILVLTWPVYVHTNGDLLVNSAVNGPVESDFVIPIRAIAAGHFRVRSVGSSEVFFASGTLRRGEQTH